MNRRIPRGLPLVLVIGSALICACPRAATAQDKPGRGGPGFRDGRFGVQNPPTDEEREKMRVRIGVTKEQQAQIEQVYKDTDEQMREINTRMRELYGQLMVSYGTYDFDRNQALAMRREIGGLHRKILMLHADNEEKLRKILNKDQFDRMRAIMKEDWERRRKEFERIRKPVPPP